MFSKKRSVCIRKIEAPKANPLELDFVKSYLNISNNTEDKSLSSIITMATEYAEWYMEKSLISQKWQVSYDGSIPIQIFLPFGPVVSIESITVKQSSSESSVLETGQYTLDTGLSRLNLMQTGYYSRIDVIYSAGYPDASLLPQQIKNGILMHTLMVYKSKNIYAEYKIDLSKVKQNYDPFRELKLVL